MLPILSNEHPLSLPIWVGSNAAIALAYLFDLNPLNARTAWHTGCPDRMAPGRAHKLWPEAAPHLCTLGSRQMHCLCGKHGARSRTVGRPLLAHPLVWCRRPRGRCLRA